MTTLTKEEKTSIINSHKRNIEFSKYNIELSLLEENSISSPSQENIDALESQLENLDKKIAALDNELASL